MPRSTPALPLKEADAQQLRQWVSAFGSMTNDYTPGVKIPRTRGIKIQRAPTVDNAKLTQFGRALAQLGIEMIAAYSPQARGRSERALRTLQDRLPKELQAAGITTLAQANRFLQRTYLRAYNREFALPAAEHGSAFVPWARANLHDILCLQEERVVRPDNCVAYHNKLLQIPADRHRCHHVKATVCVHEYPERPACCLSRTALPGALRRSWQATEVTDEKCCLSSPRSLDQPGPLLSKTGYDVGRSAGVG